MSKNNLKTGAGSLNLDSDSIEDLNLKDDKQIKIENQLEETSINFLLAFLGFKRFSPGEIMEELELRRDLSKSQEFKNKTPDDYNTKVA